MTIEIYIFFKQLADGKDDVNNDPQGNDLSAYQDYQVDNMDEFDRYSDSEKVNSYFLFDEIGFNFFLYILITSNTGFIRL